MTFHMKSVAVLAVGIIAIVPISIRDNPPAEGIGVVAERTPEIDVELPTVPVINEDDPSWDCMTMGNEQCGTQINGVWFVIQFENGEPVAVWRRDS